jgi:hypothetical protein
MTGYPIHEENQTMHTPYWWYIYSDPKKLSEGQINAILTDIDETQATEGLNVSLTQPQQPQLKNNDDGFKLDIDVEEQSPIIPEPTGNNYDKFDLILDPIDTNKNNIPNINTNNIDNFKLPLLETMELVGKGNLPLTESLKVMDIQIDLPSNKPGNTNPPKIELLIAEEDYSFCSPMELFLEYRVQIIVLLIIICFFLLL